MPTVPVGVMPVRVLSAGEPAGVIYNRSTTTQALWGTSSDQANRADASILDPNGTLAVDGTRDIWMVAASGTITVDYMQTGSAFFRALTQAFGALAIPSVFSPNFVHSVSGWSINSDGSAEFNNLTIRGTFLGQDFILNSSGFFLYSGTPAFGNLIASVTPSTGSEFLDTVGNMVVPNGLVTYNQFSPGVWVAVQYGNNGIVAWTATSAAGPYAAAGPALLFTNGSVFKLNAANGDGNAYSVGQLILVATGTTINQVTAQPIAGLSCQVGIGTYRISGSLRIVAAASGVAQAFQMQFNGTCTVSGMRIRTRAYNEANGVSMNAGTISGLASSGGSTGTMVNGSVFSVDFDGIITVSGGGTLHIDGMQATSAADETFLVQALSFAELKPQ